MRDSIEKGRGSREPLKQGRRCCCCCCCEGIGLYSAFISEQRKQTLPSTGLVPVLLESPEPDTAVSDRRGRGRQLARPRRRARQQMIGRRPGVAPGALLPAAMEATGGRRTALRALLLLCLVLGSFVSSTAAVPQGFITEAAALLAFRSAITRDPHGVLTTWGGQSSNPCGWRGVTCLASGHIADLTIARRQLAGTISPALANLTQLQMLDLHLNAFSGPLPEQVAVMPSVFRLNLQGTTSRGACRPALGGRGCASSR